MDQATFHTLETLLKTNRPPTDEEEAIIYESMALSIAKLWAVEAQISDPLAHIEVLQSQNHRAAAKIKLARLRKEEAAIMETFKDHHRVLSAVRNLPEDVLREILIACVEDRRPPILTYHTVPLPFILTQISSGIRRIALSTPIIWASMDIQFDLFHELDEQAYWILAHRVREWFERAIGVPLTLSIKVQNDGICAYTNEEYGKSVASNILLNTLFSYSACWKEIQLDQSTCQEVTTPMLRICALTATDAPLLQSVTFSLGYSIPTSLPFKTLLLKIPTLRHVSLKTSNLKHFHVNWATLTTISLKGLSYRDCYSKNKLARILQQTKCLVSCDVFVGRTGSKEEINFNKICLPFLKTLCITERASRLSPALSPKAPSLLDLLTTPNLAELHISREFFGPSVLNFLKNSPNILKLDMPYLIDDGSFKTTTAFLRQCPSLIALSLHTPYWCPIHREPDDWNGNAFLRGFVESEDDAGVMCPRLQYFQLMGQVNFSLETLHLFLERKQRSFAPLDTFPWRITPWRTVIIDIDGIRDREAQQVMLDLISQKKSEGLDVNKFVDHWTSRSDWNCYQTH